MKRKSRILCVLALCLLLLSACDWETVRSCRLRGSALENIEVELKTEGGYDLKRKGSVFHVLKDKKEILQGRMVGEEEWKKALEEIQKGTFEVIEKSEQRLVWKNGEKLCSITSVSLSYAFTEAEMSTDIRQQDILDALERLRFTWTTEEADDVIEL